MFRRNRGFSLLELLIIILIIAILIAVAVPSFFDYKLRAQRTKAKEDIDIIINAISLYELEEGKTLWDFARETEAQAAGSMNDETILNLLIGPYLKKLPVDPWGNAYVCDPEVGYVLSRGKNGQENIRDILEDQDIKVYYNSQDLQLKDAIYVDVNNDGVVAGDKLYLYFTQTICSNAAPLDLAGALADGNDTNDNGANAGVLADDDPDTGTLNTVVGITDTTEWFTAYNSDGTANEDLDIAGDAAVATIDDFTEDGNNIDHDTRVIVLTMADPTVGPSSAAAYMKSGGYINLTAVATADGGIIACDREFDVAPGPGDQVTAVATGALGVRVRIE